MDIVGGEEVERLRMQGSSDRALARSAAGESIVWGNIVAGRASVTPTNGQYVDGVFVGWFAFGVAGQGFEDAGLG